VRSTLAVRRVKWAGQQSRSFGKKKNRRESIPATAGLQGGHGPEEKKLTQKKAAPRDTWQGAKPFQGQGVQKKKRCWDRRARSEMEKKKFRRKNKSG